MERYFIFDKYNTFSDWNLILTAKSITPSEPKTNYVELDGMHGSLDLSDALTGEITFKDRTISATFWTNTGTREEREKLLRRITTAIHGRKVKIIEPDDPEHYFIGRVVIKDVRNILPYMEFTLEATCEPWRYSLVDHTRHISVNSMDSTTNLVIINNGAKTVCPLVSITGLIKLTYGNLFKLLSPGEYTVVDIKLYPGVNVIGVSGNGSATFTYKEADL